MEQRPHYLQIFPSLSLFLSIITFVFVVHFVLVGGVLIGLAAALLLLSLGRILGISGFIHTSIQGKLGEDLWRIALPCFCEWRGYAKLEDRAG